MVKKWTAFFLSFFIPGAGQLYLGERAKGLTLLSITAGLIYALSTSRSWIHFLFLGPICLFVMVPAAVDAYQTAAGKPRTFTGDSAPFVIFMLFAVGPFAVPLLWQSPKFSKTAKVLWTVLVAAVAVAVILFLSQTASMLDEFLNSNTNNSLTAGI